MNDRDTTIDFDRAERCGYTEVIFGEGKSVETLRSIFRQLLDRGQSVLATRVTDEKSAELQSTFPEARRNATARTFRIDLLTPAKRAGRVVIATAGTSDLPVAEEARETADWMGVEVELIADIGVAGPQRLLDSVDLLRTADALVVVAGMEGALPSVVGGHVACPIIAVPTSVGYGASFQGLAALLGMLNSCAANVAVVNIDAGFKAGYLAGLIAARAARPADNNA